MRSKFFERRRCKLIAEIKEVLDSLDAKRTEDIEMTTKILSCLPTGCPLPLIQDKLIPQIKEKFSVEVKDRLFFPPAKEKQIVIVSDLIIHILKEWIENIRGGETRG
ncbi:MAG: hypothetical protein GTO16_02205 [Candidatus Aminicenantes bacterium]|nr:hypothetical protein [Candidatus Aminicenantes bacterium]